ncbi:speckle-type POZ protein B-like [Schistocerca cancellata]|uniref:speckle-type POZ protein B-like n=1 Tax=Schistocerca cancellata TaxID=274614 RepID=UPI0021184713|nr:speckle-type POZ protein B-like [Schistocerca cancellata]
MATAAGAEEAADLSALLDAGDGAVATLVAGGTRLAAHRAVLAARSPVFAALLRRAGAGRVELEVRDVAGPELRLLLAGLYTLRAPRQPGAALRLLEAADRYGVPQLAADCERLAAAQLRVETAAAAAVLAVTRRYEGLARAALAFLRRHVSRVVGTPGWAHAMRTQPDALIEVIRRLADPPAETRPPFTAKFKECPKMSPVSALQLSQPLRGC